MLNRITAVAEAFVRGAYCLPLVGILVIGGTVVGNALRLKDAIIRKK